MQRKPESLAHAAVIDALRMATAALDWFYVSRAALSGAYAPDETTGTYRSGSHLLITRDDGSWEISGTDFALVYVEEMERHTYPRPRFTVGH